MTVSRSDHYRRSARISPLRWIVLTVSFVLLLLLLLVMTVRNADADYRRDEAEAIELAKTEAGLTSIDSAVKHVWEETVWVVIGKDAEGVARIVWVRESGAANDALANGLSQDQAEQRFASERPGAKIVRILPGWFQDRPAWEIRYVADPETERQAIDFYAFEDGAKLKTYELPGRTAG